MENKYKPAFPTGEKLPVTIHDLGSKTVHQTPYVPAEPGLTKREWFAGMVLMGMFTGETTNSVMKPSVKTKLAYSMADLMLIEGDL